MPRTIRRSRHKAEMVTPMMLHYLTQRMMRERCEIEERRDKATLLEVIALLGYQDGDHLTFELDEPMAYTSPGGDPKKVRSVQRQRRVSQVLNEDRTMELLEHKKLVEKCTETITVLSEDAVLAANYEGEITDQELTALYDESESFAFVLLYE